MIFGVIRIGPIFSFQRAGGARSGCRARRAEESPMYLSRVPTVLAAILWFWRDPGDRPVWTAAPTARNALRAASVEGRYILSPSGVRDVVESGFPRHWRDPGDAWREGRLWSALGSGRWNSVVGTRFSSTAEFAAARRASSPSLQRCHARTDFARRHKRVSFPAEASSLWRLTPSDTL